MSASIRPPMTSDDQAALDAVIKARTEATLTRRVPLLNSAEVFAGLKARHDQRAKRAA